MGLLSLSRESHALREVPLVGSAMLVRLQRGCTGLGVGLRRAAAMMADAWEEEDGVGLQLMLVCAQGAGVDKSEETEFGLGHGQPESALPDQV